MSGNTPGPVIVLEARHLTTLAQVEKWTKVARRIGCGDEAPVSLSSINASAAVTIYLSRARTRQS